MGTVFAAWDARLERRVAVKVHLEASDQERTRLEREARSLAKVSHPNVLTVHEVGITHDRLFVSMEYVEGETLAAWSEREHPWVDVVKVYAAAGRGLAAAHGCPWVDVVKVYAAAGRGLAAAHGWGSGWGSGRKVQVERRGSKGGSCGLHAAEIETIGSTRGHRLSKSRLP